MADTEASLDERLREVLRAHNATTCLHCGHTIGWGDIAANSASTEAGTGYSIVVIECEGCQQEIAHVMSWWPSVEDQDDMLYVLEEDWALR